MGSHTESPTTTWTVPECPFTIEYTSRVLDDIRLAVVDAFFSLPRGGAEIGGVLLGSFGAGRLTVVDCLPLDCEHAFGPGFTLSPRDRDGLAAVLASPAAHAAGLRPVGWYHSHTRSEIFLSESDQEIHNRYFPEPWQVALVLKPHTFEPMRAGFFFREAGGGLHAKASHAEFLLDPLPVRPLPGAGATEERPLVGRAEPAEIGGPVITVARDTTPVKEPQPEEPIPPPQFLVMAEQRPRRRWLKALLSVAAGAALGVVGFQTRVAWLPPLAALLHRAPALEAQPPLGLSTTDEDGQLHIRWSAGPPLLRDGANAVLVILDGEPQPQTIRLDDAHLRSGSFTYQRQSGQVDVTLSVDLPGGRKAEEATSFIGRLPVAPEPLADPALIEERDNLLKANARLESDLKKLEKTLSDVRLQLKVQQTRRLGNQDKF